MHIPKISTILFGQNLKTKELKIGRNGINNEKTAFNSEFLNHSC